VKLPKITDPEQIIGATDAEGAARQLLLTLYDAIAIYETLDKFGPGDLRMGQLAFARILLERFDWDLTSFRQRLSDKLEEQINSEAVVKWAEDKLDIVVT
jgi:hypothetical protein